MGTIRTCSSWVTSNRRLDERVALWGAAVAALLVPTSPAFGRDAERPDVTITGGVDETGHHYQWTVTNLSRLPIVRVEFPHHFADLCFAPEGWSADETTNLIKEGGKGTSGVCVGTAPNPSAGIGRNESRVFSMRIAPSGADPGRGDATVVFADGRRHVVSGVELPYPRALGDSFVSLIGLGAIFGLWLVVRMVRGRRQNAQRRPASSSGQEK